MDVVLTCLSSEFGMAKSIDNVIFYIQPTLFFVEMIKFFDFFGWMHF